LRANWSPNEIEKQVSSQVAQWYLAQFQNDLKVARSMRSAGVQMLTGSDSLDPLNFPGPSLHEEIELFTQIGFTPFQALQAATSKPAEFFNASGTDGWGTIAPGKIADLALLEADPLADIRNTRRIAAVIRGGKLLARDDLNRMLERARAAAEAINPRGQSAGHSGRSDRAGSRASSSADETPPIHLSLFDSLRFFLRDESACEIDSRSAP
jgi:hypothetical protein